MTTNMSMLVTKFETNEEWMQARRGKITGSGAKDITPKARGTGYKDGFYALIAEKLSIPRDEENPMDRGHRLEEEAVARFAEDTGLEVDTSLQIWSRQDDESIAISPDGVVEGKPWAVEVKCLSDAKHIKAYMTQEIPDDYEEQILQYFVVNDDLEKVFMVFYDPNLSVKDYFYLEINRDQQRVEQFLEMERQVLEQVRAAVMELSF